MNGIIKAGKLDYVIIPVNSAVLLDEEFDNQLNLGREPSGMNILRNLIQSKK